MNQFFSTDNKIFGCIDKIVDSMWLSILWLISCIPLITIGAATTAMYYTVNKYICHDRGNLASEYFHSFKMNFKQATIIWIIIAIVSSIVCFDYFVLYRFAQEGKGFGNYIIFLIIITLLLMMWGIYIFPYCARFEDTTKMVIKNTLIIALSNFQWSFAMVVLLLCMVIVVIVCPLMIVIVPTIYQLIKSNMIERVFVKYMKPEDIELEKERNRKYYN